MFFRFILVCSYLSAVSAMADILNNHEAPNYQSGERCLSALTHAQHSQQTSYAFETSITPDRSLNILSWNIEKGINAGWQNDLNQFTKSADFILLQEAVLGEKMLSPNDADLYWSFSKGYTTQHYISGVLIASPHTPEFTCTLEITEPWLRSPKSSLLAYFQFDQTTPTIVVNLHAVNFTLGVKAFAEQLGTLQKILTNYQGQLIVAGDFNTWNSDRLHLLQQFTAHLQLTEAHFTPDNRTQKFGQVLDYIFIRNFEVISSAVKSVSSSDHNPLLISVRHKNRDLDPDIALVHESKTSLSTPPSVN